MRTSQETSELDTALAAAQAEFPKVVKDADNPYYKSKYADLASLINVVQATLGKHNLAIRQHLETETTSYVDDSGVVQGERLILLVTTRISHKSGQFEESTLRVPLTDGKPQTLGSASTYARRYALQSVLRVAGEDDDGNAASLNENWSEEKRKKYVEQKKLDLAQKPLRLDIKQQLEESLKVTPPPASAGVIMGTGSAQGSPSLTGHEEPSQPPGRPDLTISPNQQKRLFAIAKSAGMSDETIREAVGACGYESTKEIPIDKYDAVIDFLDPDFKFHPRSKFQKRVNQ